MKRSVESVLVLVKPDGIRKQLAGNVLEQFQAGGVELAGLKLVQVSRRLAQEHYGHLRGQFFFEQIVSYLTGQLHGGSPVVAMVFKGKDAVKKCRRIAGATNPEEAEPASIRGKFGRITTKGVYENLVHVSSDPKEAKREINLWFKKSEII
jgi:nucleoside-diphosphate kinase